MTTAPQKSPDWFDIYWEVHSHELPFMLRGESMKNIARSLVAGLIESMGAQAQTPEGVRAIIAFGRIRAIVNGTRGVLDCPDPSPDQIADAVQRLVERVKP